MNGKELARRLVREDEIDYYGIDFKKFKNKIGKFKSRELERGEEKVQNMKMPIEFNKTVARRLQMKLMERGRTPNLKANFYVHL